MSSNTKNFMRASGAEWVIGGALVSGKNNGAVTTAATTKVKEYGDGLNHTTVLTLASFVVGTSGDNTSKAIGASLYTLPAGAVIVDNSHVSVGLTLADAVQTDTPELGIGTAVGTGAVATIGAVSAGAENIFEGTATANVSGTALVGTKLPTAAVPLIVASGDSHVLYLNAAVAWADLTAPATVTATGTVTINWRYLG